MEQRTNQDSDPRLKSVSEKISIWNKEHCTPEIKAKIAQTLKKLYANGMPVPQSKSGYRNDLQQYFRSTWESNYVRYLNFVGLKWEYESHRFPFYDETGDIICVYIPDFYVNNEFIEIKDHAESNSYWSCDCKRCKRDKMKMAMFLSYPQHSIRMIEKAEYKEINNKYRMIVPFWE